MMPLSLRVAPLFLARVAQSCVGDHSLIMSVALSGVLAYIAPLGHHAGARPAYKASPMIRARIVSRVELRWCLVMAS